MPLTEGEKLAWVAGIIDGEGSIVLTHSSARSSDAYCYPLLKVCNTNIKMIREVIGILGVPKRIEKLRKVKIYHKQAYAVQYASNEAIAILKRVLPYLIAKKRQADLCIVLWKVNKIILEKFGMVTKTGKKIFTNGHQLPVELLAFRQRCFNEMKTLNQRGYLCHL